MEKLGDDLPMQNWHEDFKSDELSGLVDIKNGIATVNAMDMHYQRLNFILKSLSGNMAREIHVRNVYGQRYIGTGCQSDVELHIHGTPGNDLAAFMDGPTIHVHGNAQDGVGNTMNSGKVVVHGHSGDIAAYSMRGGKLFIRDDAGYRVGIHMKEGNGQKPVLVIGGTAQDFLGEYMAGGILVVLGLTVKGGDSHRARFVGTGMHGGTIYIRGKAADVGKEVDELELDKGDRALLQPLIEEFCDYFKLEADNLLAEEFRKLVPSSSRPYGMLYTQAKK